MKHGVLLSSFLLLLSAGASAQTNFQPGYVVPLTGDTLRGEVDARGAQRNARLSRFRPSAEAAVTEYQPAQLRGYGFTHDRVYQTGTVPLLEVVKRRSVLDVEAAAVAQPAFLEVLVLGPASLLYLRDANNKDHYYLRLQADGVVQELLTTTTSNQVNGVDYKQQSDEYKRTLAAATKACLVVQPQINALHYTEAELVRVVRRYNECVGGTSVAPAAAQRKNFVRLGVVAGVQRGQLELFDQLGKLKFNSSVSPVVGLALQMSLAGLNRAVSARLEVIYSPQSYAGKGTGKGYYTSLQRELYAKLPSIHVPLLVRYTFPRGPVRPFAQVGYSGSYFLKTQNTYHQQSSVSGTPTIEAVPVVKDTRNFETGLTGGLGLTTARVNARNLGLELRYARTNGFSDEVSFGTRIHRFSLLLSYDLTK